MAAPKGNKFWKQRNRHGRKKESYYKIIKQTVYPVTSNKIRIFRCLKQQEQGFEDISSNNWDDNVIIGWDDLTELPKEWNDTPDWN